MGYDDRTKTESTQNGAVDLNTLEPFRDVTAPSIGQALDRRREEIENNNIFDPTKAANGSGQQTVAAGTVNYSGASHSNNPDEVVYGPRRRKGDRGDREDGYWADYQRQHQTAQSGTLHQMDGGAERLDADRAIGVTGADQSVENQRRALSSDGEREALNAFVRNGTNRDEAQRQLADSRRTGASPEIAGMVPQYMAIMPEFVPSGRLPGSSAQHGAEHDGGGAFGALGRLGKGLLAIGGGIADTFVSFGRGVAEAGGAVLGTIFSLQTYRDMGSFIGDTFSGFGKFLGDSFRFLTNGDTWRAAWHFITSKETWDTVGNAIKTAWNFITSGDTWRTVGNWLKNAGVAVADYFKLWVTDPAKAAEMTWNGIKSAGKFIKHMAESLGLVDMGVGLFNLVKAPVMLIWDLGAAGARTALDLGRVMTGEMSADQLRSNLSTRVSDSFSNFGESVVQAGRLLKGAVIMAGEFTGIADVVYMCSYALQGNWAMAAMHAGFAVAQIGSIVATVVTAGAAAGAIALVMSGRASVKAAAQKVLEVALKEFFEIGAEEIGKVAIKEMGEHMSKETLERTAEEAVDLGSKKMVAVLAREGEEAMATELTQKCMKEGMGEAVEALYKKAGLIEIVEKNVFALLTALEEESFKKFQKKLASTALKDLPVTEAAFKAARKTLMRGAADTEIKAVLEAGIKAQIQAHVEQCMESAFKKRLAQTLSGELGTAEAKIISKALKAQAKRLGKLEAELIEAHVEAGWKGAREAIEEVTQKFVREGIERAFKRFRHRDQDRHPAQPRKQEFEHKKAPEEKKAAEKPREVFDDPERVVAEEGELPDQFGQVFRRTEFRLEGDQVVCVTLERRASETEWHEVAQEVLDDMADDLARAKKSKAA